MDDATDKTAEEDSFDIPQELIKLFPYGPGY